MISKNLQLNNIRFGQIAQTQDKQSGDRLQLESDGQFDRNIIDQFRSSVNDDPGWIPGLRDPRLNSLVDEFSKMPKGWQGIETRTAAKVKESLGPTWEGRITYRGESVIDRHWVLKAKRSAEGETAGRVSQSLEIALPHRPGEPEARVALEANDLEATGGSYFEAHQSISANWQRGRGPILASVNESAGITSHER
jgi:hypothetical protein